jgi:hypothetical protein
MDISHSVAAQRLQNPKPLLQKLLHRKELSLCKLLWKKIESQIQRSKTTNRLEMMSVVEEAEALKLQGGLSLAAIVLLEELLRLLMNLSKKKYLTISRKSSMRTCSTRRIYKIRLTSSGKFTLTIIISETYLRNKSSRSEI